MSNIRQPKDKKQTEITKSTIEISPELTLEDGRYKHALGLRQYLYNNIIDEADYFIDHCKTADDECHFVQRLNRDGSVNIQVIKGDIEIVRKLVTDESDSHRKGQVIW